MDTESKDGLLKAYKLDGKGGAEALDWSGVKQFWDDEDFVWVHLDYTHEHAKQWLQSLDSLDAITARALVSENTRPRCTTSGDGMLLNLRQSM